MSTAFSVDDYVLMQELFDGRLQLYGIVEKIVPDKTSEGDRMLVDARGNYLWVHADDDGYVSEMTGHGLQSPSRILRAIAAAFETECHSEHEPQFYGFNTEEEFDAAMKKLVLEERDRDYEDAVKFVTGREHGFTPGTIGMRKGEIAKAVALSNPDLLLPQNKDEFLRVIDERYQREYPLVITETDEMEMDLAELLVADVDDLPRA